MYKQIKAIIHMTEENTTTTKTREVVASFVVCREMLIIIFFIFKFVISFIFSNFPCIYTQHNKERAQKLNGSKKRKKLK